MQCSSLLQARLAAPGNPACTPSCTRQLEATCISIEACGTDGLAPAVIPALRCQVLWPFPKATESQSARHTARGFAMQFHVLVALLKPSGSHGNSLEWPERA